jgi:predicted RNA-binding protein YlqC (UPF0109 family)
MATSNTSNVPDEPMQQLLLQIVQMLVDDDKAVQIDCLEANGETLLNLRVAPSETGKVIGKQGRTARSIRTILMAAGMKARRRYGVNIHEEPADPSS